MLMPVGAIVCALGLIPFIATADELEACTGSGRPGGCRIESCTPLVIKYPQMLFSSATTTHILTDSSIDRYQCNSQCWTECVSSKQREMPLLRTYYVLTRARGRAPSARAGMAA
ncbi:hypothetical protein BD309DRAFT_774887 [Dichomitus squalens]|nr:hypothetical protein BD309DRAFT_774887 [Dichomitus squalens]